MNIAPPQPKKITQPPSVCVRPVPPAPIRIPADLHQRRNLRAMMADGAAYSLMVGLGESYLPAFALALGMGEVVAGLIATVPLLGGALLQMISPAGVLWLRSNRRWVLLCAAIQAVTFAPLIAAALAGWIPVPLLFVIASVYWGSNMAGISAWNTWAGTLVPCEIRARYFSRRTRYTQAAVLLGYVLGGIALQTGATGGHPLGAFAILFLVAAACRVISTGFLASQSEPAPPSETHRVLRLPEVLKRFRYHGEGRLLLYLILMQAAAQIASPFFAPFMLRQLRFSYVNFMIVTAAAMVAKIIALPLLGRMTHRLGARWLLTFGGLMVIPIPLLWMLNHSVPWLILLQIIAGISWGAYELAMFLLFLERMHDGERTSMLTTFNVANSAATVAGASVGALLLSWLGETHSIYMVVFALSCAMRLLTIPFLRRIPLAHVQSGSLEATSEPPQPIIRLPIRHLNPQASDRAAA